ncbi:hypothetical protein Btru_009579 [Bulinus truncatus]|nr:hypothetical protein Btru_009579 [Bulinus truncatus]
MDTGENVTSQIAIGTSASLNNLNNGADYNYDGFVINKSKNNSGHLEYSDPNKWHTPKDAVLEKFYMNGQGDSCVINKKRISKIEVLPEEDKFSEYEDKDISSVSQPVHVKRQNTADLVHFKEQYCRDIEQPVVDKRQLKKKEVLRPEIRDGYFNAFHKQTHKRCADDQSKEEMFEEMKVFSLRETEQVNELINNINLKKQLDPKCISFDRQKFSAVENLDDDSHLKNSGSFGEVSKVIDRKTQTRLIRKKIKDKVEVNEVVVPSQFLHESNICSVYGLYFDRLNAYIIQEDAGFSVRQLGTAVEFREKLRQPEMMENIVLGIYQGLAVLERNNIVHCDIKPENVCLSINSEGLYVTKLIDFGSCRTGVDKMTYAGLTPEYLPPNINEFLFNAMQKKLPDLSQYPKVTCKDDVWGAGMVTLYMEKGEHPIIKFFTGHPDYPKDNTAMSLRRQVMKKTADLQNPLDKYFTTGKVILDEMLQNVLLVDSHKRWTSSNVVTFLKGKLNPEPQTKRQRNDLLSLPKMVHMEHTLIKRDNSVEDVDLKVSKGIYQPHMPASPQEAMFVDNFGAAFKLKQDGHQSVLSVFDQHKSQVTTSVQHHTSGQGDPFNYTVSQNLRHPGANPTAGHPQIMCRQKPDKVMMEESMDHTNDQMEYEELVQSFCSPDNQIIDKKRVGRPQNLYETQPATYVMQGLGGGMFQVNGVSSNVMGNIPDMLALFDDSCDDVRIKIKGRRRSKRD